MFSSIKYSQENEYKVTDFWVSADRVRWRRLHHPFGTPQVVQPDVSFCLLHHSDYLSGYSRDRLQPLWVSYTIPSVVSETVHCCSISKHSLCGGLCSRCGQGLAADMDEVVQL